MKDKEEIARISFTLDENDIPRTPVALKVKPEHGEPIVIPIPRPTSDIKMEVIHFEAEIIDEDEDK